MMDTMQSGTGRRIGGHTRRGSGAAWLGLIVLALMPAVGCDRGADTGAANAGGESLTESAEPHDPDALRLVFPYGSEKKAWLTELTDTFNRAGHKSTSGKTIYIEAVPMGSGETIDAILSGRLEAHLVSPASEAFIKLGDARSKVAVGEELVGRTRQLVVSPVVIAMWKPMAEALGWGQKDIGWAEILDLVRNSEGWGAYGYPQWGRFKFGHTHPDYSNSGLISLFAEVYAATGKTEPLTIEDVQKPETAAFLHEIESSVVHYGRSTGFFGHKLIDGGPQYLSAAVLYENLVIESYDRSKHPARGNPPIVAIYPKEGTFWSDHPVGVVNRDWVTEEHKEAAEQYIEFLLARPQQERAMAYGFRPADLKVKLGAPIDEAHGVDPTQPRTILPVPSVSVMAAVKDLWKAQKKHANVVLVMDTSGSMQQQDRLTNAKLGALKLVQMLSDEDTVSFIQFSQRVNWIVKDAKLKDQRHRVEMSIRSMMADGGTALYDAIDAAREHTSASPKPDRINAIVVLTDGENTEGRLRNHRDLISRIGFDGEQRNVRVFAIGYGSGAKMGVLKEISESTQAKAYKGDPQTIEEVFHEISTFF